jgi:hypothetical protein
MIVATLIVTLLEPMLPLITGPLPPDSVFVQTINQIEPTFPLIVIIGSAFALIARGLVEANLPGA